MGEVFLGVVRGPGGFSKLNVIKRLRSDLAADQAFVEMFLNEARLAGRLSHPNIVQTKEVGIDGDAHFMVMEYLEGQTLFYILRKLRRNESGVSLLPGPPAPDSNPSGMSGPRSSSFTGMCSGPRSMRLVHPASGFTLAMHLQIISEVLVGLHYAHEARDFSGQPLNLIHRDIAPGNIFVTYDGQVKVLDFGIAKAADSTNSTRAGVFKGKVAYMAPEQFMNANIDRRCDIFAVGATLWEAAAGTRLWRGLSDVEIFRHLADGHIPPPSTVAPDVDPRLEAICMRALAFNRDQRYGTAEELREDLDQFIDAIGRPSREEVGHVVASMFTTERAQTKATIEGALRALRNQEASAAMQTRDGYVAVVSSDPATGTGRTPSKLSEMPPKKSKAGVVAAALVAVAAAGGGVAWYKTRPAAPAVVSAPASAGSLASISAASTGLAESGAAPANAAPAAPTSVSLHISATPSSATLYLDDVKLPRNPYATTVAADTSSHRLRVEAPGYRAQTDFVQFTGSEPITLDVILTAEKPAKSTWIPPRKSPKPEPPAAPPAVAPVAPPPPSATQKARPKTVEIDTSDPYSTNK